MHKLKRSADLLSRTKALEELATSLDLEQPPLRIECIDVSNISGTSTTASLVVFEDGILKRSITEASTLNLSKAKMIQEQFMRQ